MFSPSSISFCSLDRHFGRLMEEFSGGANAPLRAAAALASRAIQEGDVCVNLADYAGKQLSLFGEEALLEPIPALSEWVSALAASPVVATRGEERPLVLWGNRLYLFRYWTYENKFVSQLRQRCVGIVSDFDPELARATMLQLFKVSHDRANQQQIAAAVALLKKFCLISGGPGTGKTSTVIRIAALLATLYAGRTFTIALAAPTGKAATRLEESIAALLPDLPCTPEAAAAIPTTASTVHALLKPIPDSPYFRHDVNHPLSCDVLIVDEASMIDLALMTKLLDAMPIDSRVILVGDRDQLASVEAGALLADLCGSDPTGYSAEMAASIRGIVPEFRGPCGEGSPLADSIVTLRTNYRFGNLSGIGQVSSAINSGDFDAVKSILTDQSFPDCRWWVPQSYADLLARLGSVVLDRWRSCFAAEDPLEALSRFAEFRILCAVRNGHFGVEGINARVETILAAEGLIPVTGFHYRGKLIMITRNDYPISLFNGDVGIVMPDGADRGVLKAFFPAGNSHVKAISLGRLPPHETAYAMTVHKAQGSEFKETIFILPPNPSPLMTRELLYTGVTRARGRSELWCSEETLRSGVTTRLQRISGLREKLSGTLFPCNAVTKESLKKP
jgi:exodeoxyribonuclease V alpha subunit